MTREQRQKKLIEDFKKAINLATVGVLWTYEFYEPEDEKGKVRLCEKMKKTYKKYLQNY